jgi:hypothetical protein
MRVRDAGSLVGLLGERPATGRAGHPFARLVVEVVARGRRGSGYLVGEDTVLTAAQPVRRAARIVIRLDPGSAAEREAVAAVVWLDVDADLAVLRLSPGAGPQRTAPTRYGRLGARPRSLDVLTSHGPAAPVIVIGAASDTLELAAPGAVSDASPAGRSPDAAASEVWRAMPGAVAFSGGLAVGVVSARDRYAVARLDHHLGHARSGRRLAALLEAGPLVDVI